MSDIEDAQVALKRLSGKIVLAQTAVRTTPSLEVLAWHLQMARKWFGDASSQSRGEDYDSAVDYVNMGEFHASVAVETAKEFAAAVAFLQHTGSEPAVFTGGAEDTDDADYCAAEDDDRHAAFVEWRKMALLSARCKAVVAVHVIGKERVFDDAHSYLEFAVDLAKQTEDVSDDDMRQYFDDGLVFVRTAIKATAKFLLNYDVTVELPKAKWDTDDEVPDDTDCDESREAIVAFAEALAKVRYTLARSTTAVKVAAFHLEAAENFIVTSKDKYVSKDYTESTDEAKLGLFHALLAAEAVSVYNSECANLAEGKASTANDDPDSPDDDRLEVCDDDDTKTGVEEWRKLSLATAKVQALLDTKAKGLITAEDHLESVMAYTEKVQSASWDDVPGIVEDGMFFIETAVEAAEAYAAPKA
jgi:hypothetical protein